jgi:hypothetical protein
MFIAEFHSNRCIPKGQPAAGQRFVPAALALLLLLALGFAVSGCTSIYHRTRTKFPPEASAEARLRITEAQRAEAIASQAAGKLHDHLSRGFPAEAVDTDVNRLELAAWELERRVLAARDAAARCAEATSMASEIERLNRRAETWINYVQTSAQADNATRLHQLKALLRDAASP